MKKSKRKVILLCLVGMIVIGGAAILYYYKTNYITAVFQPKQQTEITGMLNRTECGWYQLYSYYLQPNTNLTTDELYIEKKDKSGYEYRLALVEFNLKDYVAQPLDHSAKENIQTVLRRFSRTKAKVIVRFLYDWDGKGSENEPSNIKWILKHMKQAGALLNQYKDFIYTTQGIFVGSWAEMHDSKYLSDQDMTTLLLQFASATDESIYLAVRTPEQYRTIFQEIEKHPERYEKFEISPEALKKRLGLFNDGMLGSISDVGTYHKADIANTEAEKKKIRNSELAFQNDLAIQVPNGGEVVNDCKWNDSTVAITDLSTMHVSYLNQMYDEAVIRKWKKSTYKNETSIYNGCSTYDYITQHMGARFVLKESSLSYQPFQEGDATGKIILENVGFSNLYHAKDFTLSIKSKTSNQEQILLSSKEEKNINACHWNPGQTVTMSFSFSPFSLKDGIYYLTATLTDPVTKEIISFANDSYDEELSGYCLGKITIQR